MNPVEIAFAAYGDALAKKDVDQMVELYDEQVLLFDVEDQWFLSGREAWRSVVKGWFDWLGSETLTADFEPIKITVSDQLIAAAAFVTYTALSADGGRLRAKKERLTWILSSTPDGWRISHCHNSIPIDPGTGKPRTDV